MESRVASGPMLQTVSTASPSMIFESTPSRQTHCKSCWGTVAHDHCSNEASPFTLSPVKIESFGIFVLSAPSLIKLCKMEETYWWWDPKPSGLEGLFLGTCLASISLVNAAIICFSSLVWRDLKCVSNSGITGSSPFLGVEDGGLSVPSSSFSTGKYSNSSPSSRVSPPIVWQPWRVSHVWAFLGLDAYVYPPTGDPQ